MSKWSERQYQAWKHFILFTREFERRIDLPFVSLGGSRKNAYFLQNWAKVHPLWGSLLQAILAAIGLFVVGIMLTLIAGASSLSTAVIMGVATFVLTFLIGIWSNRNYRRYGDPTSEGPPTS